MSTDFSTIKIQQSGKITEICITDDEIKCGKRNIAGPGTTTGNSTIQSSNDNILILMIGNMPGDKDCKAHFKKFIETADDTLHMVIHPMKLEISQSIIDEWQPLFKKKDKFMVCDANHWVRTEWGNISLSLATLLGIEYAMKNKPYNYYKKIVFIQQCMPIYNYNIIKKEFLKDDKSWFKPRNGHYAGYQYTQPYNFNREKDNGSTINDWNWWSAIFALDRSHFDIFFDKTNVIDGKYMGTYKKEGLYKCNGKDFDDVIPLKPNDSHDVLFKQVRANWDWYNLTFKESCVNSDEVFFGLAFKHNFQGNTISNNVRIINVPSLENLYDKNILSANPKSNNFLYLFTEDDKKIINNFVNNFGENNNYPILPLQPKITNITDDLYIYLPRIVWLKSELYKNSSNFPLYTGVVTNYNPERLKEYYVLRKENSSSSNYRRVFKGKEEVVPANTGTLLHDNFKVLKVQNTTNDPNQFTNINELDLPLTYHDWTSFSISPINLLRDSKFIVNGNPIIENPISILNKSVAEVLAFINNKEIQDGKLPIWHPVEYYTVSLKQIVNTYNILSLCKNVNNPDASKYNYNSNGNHNLANISKIARFVYKRAILLFSDYVVEKNNNGSYFEFNSALNEQNSEKIRLGTCLTEEILSSALAIGSLFIRKCVEGSEISKFTTILNNLQVYVPDISSDEISSLPEKNKFGEFLDIPDTIFNPKLGVQIGGNDEQYREKYLKYKSKYLQLKNTLY